MFSANLGPLVITGFVVALFHAAIPTHWLPFVLVARARRWSRAKALLVTAIAGLGHVLLTSVLGLIIAWCGFQIDERLERAFPWTAGGLLLAIGGYYTWRQVRGTGTCAHASICRHSRAAATHAEAPAPACEHRGGELPPGALAPTRAADTAAISGLFVTLTLSPCEGFLPLYVSGVPFGWDGFFVLSATLALATLLVMLLFTYLTLVGTDRLKLPRLERYDAGLLGVVFSVLGVLVLTAGH